MCSNLPPSEPSRQDDLLACLRTIRRYAFGRSASPADALIDIRDAIRQYDGEFADQE